jgi:hypothetical protein
MNPNFFLSEKQPPPNKIRKEVPPTPALRDFHIRIPRLSQRQLEGTTPALRDFHIQIPRLSQRQIEGRSFTPPPEIDSDVETEQSNIPNLDEEEKNEPVTFAGEDISYPPPGENIDGDMATEELINQPEILEDRDDILKTFRTQEILDDREESERLPPTVSDAEEENQNNTLDPEIDALTPVTTQNGLTLTLINKRVILDSYLTIMEYSLTGPKKIVNLVDVMASLNFLMQTAIDSLNAAPQDRIQAVIWSDVSEAICTPCTLACEFNVSFILAAVQKASQSGNNLSLENNIRIDLKHFRRSDIMLRGGRKQYKQIICDMYRKERRCIIEINNPKDNLCMARSLVVALAKIKLDRNKQNLKKKKSTRLYVEIRV